MWTIALGIVLGVILLWALPWVIAWVVVLIFNIVMAPFNFAYWLIHLFDPKDKK